MKAGHETRASNRSASVSLAPTQKLDRCQGFCKQIFLRYLERLKGLIREAEAEGGEFARLKQRS